MLDTLRASATGIFAKILLGLLVIMFVVWGIGDIIRHPSSRFTIASVGNETVGSDDYLRALRREEENIRQIMGDNFSPEILKNPMVTHHVLQQLINHALIKQESQALGLIPSDADVVHRIRTNPAFEDDKGAFDKKLFEGMLQASRITEKHYVDQLRQEMASNLLVETITHKVPVPDIEVATLLASREEGRNISLYSLKQSAVAAIPAPDATQIKTYYDAHTHDFTAPDYRTVSYISLNNSNVSHDVKIPEDDLRAAYKERLDEFKHPEKRVVEQLLYSTKDAADKGSAMLKSGSKFEDVGKGADVINKGALLLGKVERGNVIENAADKVFSLEAGQTTDPIESPFGWHIFRVTSIEPAAVSSFEEVRPQLEKELALRGEDDELNTLANKFQDALAGGSSLAEAAHDFNLKVTTVGPFDHQGNTPENKKAALPELNKFVEVAFKTEENNESPMTTSKGGTYYLLYVDKVTPERLRPLAEVKTQVIAGWQKEEHAKRMQDLAQEIGKKFVDHAQRDALIEKYQIALDKTLVIRRNTLSVGDISLPAELVKDIFSRKPQEGTAAYMTNNGDYLLAAVNTIVPAPLPGSDPKMAATSADIRKGLETVGQNEILDEYTSYLAHKYRVSINESAMQAVQK